MGKAGRFACIVTPMVFTLATLACFFVIGTGGRHQSSNFETSLYFFRADTSNINSGDKGLSIDGMFIGDHLSPDAKNPTGVAAFYEIYTWNYCSGDANGIITYCSPHTLGFWFNPQEAWGLNNTLANQIFSSELKDGLNVYRQTAKWMFVAYMIAFWVTVAEFVVGILAICSRWGSFVTTIVAGVATFFSIAWAVTATAMYSILAGTFDTALRQYDVHASLGRKGFAVTWLAVAFSVAAGLFWTISICCCSGRSEHKRDSMPSKYERVPSPYEFGSAQPAPQTREWSEHKGPHFKEPVSTAYEPYREV